MSFHAGRETKTPIYSFGQGCEGDPLMNPDLLVESVRLFRSRGGVGTVNCNTNASRTEAVERLAQAGLSSIRVSLNSARPEVYERYYRPHGYSFDDVRRSIAVAPEERPLGLAEPALLPRCHRQRRRAGSPGPPGGRERREHDPVA